MHVGRVNTKVSDADLLELAGYWVYEITNFPDKYLIGTKITVNGTEYKILDVQYSNPQAITMQNEATGEVVVIYRGTDFSDADDVYTDVGLMLGQATPQFQGVLDYYDMVSGEYGNITAVAGNSLGGALANHVAVHRPNDCLTSVTLDPAPLPYGLDTLEVDPETYASFYNYVATTSPLYLLFNQTTPGDRIPGGYMDILVEYGIFSFLNIGANHTGYDRDNQPNGVQGFGIDDMIPFSIWDNHIIGSTGYSGGRIEINKENLEMLSNTLNTRMEEVRGHLLGYLDPTYELIRDESGKLFDRQSGLVELVIETFETHLIKVLNIMEHVQNIKTILNGIDGSTFSFEELDLTIFNNSLKQASETAFLDENTGYTDGFVEKLEKHHEVIEENLHTIMEKWNYVAASSTHIYESFSALEEAVTTSITTGQGIGTISVPNVARPQKAVRESNEFGAIKTATEAKQEQLEITFKAFGDVIYRLLLDVYSVGELAIVAAKAAIFGVKTYMETEYTIQQAGWRTIITGTEDEYYKEIYQNQWNDKEIGYQTIFTELTRLDELVDTILAELQVLMAQMPTMIEELKPYISQLIFFGTTFGEVQRNIYASIGLANNASLVFNEIWTRIEENESEGITALREVSNEISNDLAKLVEQMSAITTGQTETQTQQRQTPNRPIPNNNTFGGNRNRGRAGS